MLISYVIATQAKSTKLLALLQDLAGQLTGITDVEVVVVVNGVADRGVLEGSAYVQEGLDLFRCYRMDEPGSALARLKAASFSRGIYLWFLDDDVRLTEGYVNHCRSFLQKNQVDFGGGPIYLLPSLTLPPWAAKAEIYRWLTIENPQGNFDSSDTKYNAGANAFLRREDLLLIEPKIRNAPYALGRKGKSLLSGEDTDFWYRLHRLKRKHQNCPDALVYHDIHLDRLSEAWFIQRADMESISLWCRLRNYGLSFFFLELLRKAPGIVVSSVRYFFSSVILGRKDLARTLHFRERTAFFPHFGRLLLARPLDVADPKEVPVATTS